MTRISMASSTATATIASAGEWLPGEALTCNLDTCNFIVAGEFDIMHKSTPGKT